MSGRRRSLEIARFFAGASREVNATGAGARFCHAGAARQEDNVRNLSRTGREMLRCSKICGRATMTAAAPANHPYTVEMVRDMNAVRENFLARSRAKVPAFAAGVRR